MLTSTSTRWYGDPALILSSKLPYFCTCLKATSMNQRPLTLTTNYIHQGFICSWNSRNVLQFYGLPIWPLLANSNLESLQTWTLSIYVLKDKGPLPWFQIPSEAFTAPLVKKEELGIFCLISIPASVPHLSITSFFFFFNSSSSGEKGPVLKENQWGT